MSSVAVESGGQPETQDDWYEIAERVLPGAGLGGYALPEAERFVIRRGEGCRLLGSDGKWRIDYVCGAGALILGHAHPAVTEAVQAQIPDGIHFFGTLNEKAILLADELVDAIPCAEKVLFATTGSEATFYAMRLARAFTGRDCILKFEGGYHGNHDYSQFAVAPKAVSNYPAGQADTAGIPASTQDSVMIAPYNDLEAVRRLVEEHRAELAAIIVEPIQRIVCPKPDFLPGLRKICDDNGILLIYDEVVTGFRLAYGGAQEFFGVKPDLAAYGKVVGGASALSAVAGPAEIIDLSAPTNKGQSNYAYINGTLHGNPVAATAGLATLAELREPAFYKSLNALGDTVRKEVQAVLDHHGLPAVATGDASLWQTLFTDKAPASYADMLSVDSEKTRAFDLALLRHGIYALPGVRRFVSSAHAEADIDDTLKALDAACREFA